MCIQAPLQPPPKIRSSTLVNFHFPIPPLLIHEIIFTIPTNTHFFYTSAIFHLPTSCVQPSQRSTPKIFFLPHPFDQFRLHQETRELGSLVKTGTVLIFPFFRKVRTVITGLTITNFL